MKSPRRKRRRGYTLVFFAMFLFAFMAMAALVIDIGFARLTQRQMQTAADSAALEGLRGSGSIGYSERQDAARNFVAWHFDDDLDTTDDDGAFDSGSGQFGAGPLVQFSGGEGDPTLAASQLMSVDPNAPVYKPVMLNGSNGSPSTSGFQVAIQRGVADASEADLYSLGPAVPYLFARGSLINRQLIQRGVVVRATAIADARPVVCVGAPNLAIGMPGRLGVAVSLVKWDQGLPIPRSDTYPVFANSIGEKVNIENDSENHVQAATGFIAIFWESEDAANRCVVGYGEASIDADGTVTKISGSDGAVQIASTNASSTFIYPYSGTANDIEIVISENQKLIQRDDILLAPVSVR